MSRERIEIAGTRLAFSTDSHGCDGCGREGVELHLEIPLESHGGEFACVCLDCVERIAKTYAQHVKPERTQPLTLDAYDAHRARDALRERTPSKDSLGFVVAYLTAIHGGGLTARDMAFCAYGYPINGVELPPLTRSMFTRVGGFLTAPRYFLDADICIALQAREKAARGETTP